MQRKRPRTTLAAVLLTLIFCSQPVDARDHSQKWEERIDESIVVSSEKIEGKTYHKATIVTPASVAKVWNSIIEEPNYDNHLVHKRVLSKNESRTIMEEEFDGVPLVGHTKAVVQADETPHSALTYTLLKSNHFKHLDATWTLTRCAKTNNTIVELRCYVEPKVFCPQMVLNSIIAGRVKRRMTFVREFAQGSIPERLAYNTATEKN